MSGNPPKVSPEEQAIAMAMQQMMGGMEMMQAQVLEKLETMSQRVVEMETAMKILMEKSGVDPAELARQVQEEMKQIENQQKLQNPPGTQ